MKAIIRLIALWAGTALPATAQEQIFQPGQFFIEGVSAYCGDIQTVVRSSGPLVEAPDTFRIAVNGPSFDALPVTMRLFAYFQTCGMIFYGDDLVAADAFAARRGIRDRWLSAADIEAICQTDDLAEAGWAAAPDATRCEAIYVVMREALAQ